MSWLAPLALTALVPLAGIIVLLYLLKLRRRELLVPSVFLWRQATDDVQANAPFQRLRASLLLLLQLIAIALLVTALAGPFVMARRLSGRTSVVVLDSSASMSAIDAGGVRFEQARRAAGELIGSMSGRDEMALIECADRARVIVPLTGRRRELQSALGRLAPTDCPGNIRDGVLLAMSLAASRSDATVYVVSDGAFGPVGQVAGAARVRFVGVGEDAGNVALLAFEASRPPGAEEHQVFVRVRNFADAPRECVLSIYHEDELLDARKLTLKAGETHGASYAAQIGEAGLLRAEIEVDDALASDNVAFASVVPPQSLSALLVGPGNLFLEQALLVLPEVEVFKTASLDASEAAAAFAEHDLVIFDRVPVPAPPRAGAAMMIAAGGWPEVATLGESVAGGSMTRWDDQHPALRYVNLGAASVAKARALAPGDGARAIAHLGDAPVIVAYESPNVRALALGFDLLDSDLPLRVGFPVMLSNTVRWLTDVARRQELALGRPGETLVAATAPELSSVQIVLPGGGQVRVPADGGQAVYGDTQRVGVYELRAGEERRRWALDLRDPVESDLAPRSELELGARRVESSGGQLRAERHLWPWLIALALVVLMAEWHLYHRRY
jgi:hypothetical protein